MRGIRELLSRLNGGILEKILLKNLAATLRASSSLDLVKTSSIHQASFLLALGLAQIFSDEVFFLGCRNLGMICVEICHNIKGEESPSLQPRPRPHSRSLREPDQNPPRPGLTLPPLRVLRRRTRNARAINSILSFSEPLNSSVSSRACCRRKSFRILRKDCFQVSGSKVPSCK